MKYFILILIFIPYFFGYSQQLSDDFVILKSEGKIPDNLCMLSVEKFKKDLNENKNKDLDRNFFKSTRIMIDELLLSGRVLFNDPVSNYVNDVANILLKDQKELKENLDFYVVRSVTPNAFSTDQGIIFITIGLIARLENEAQLAFVLAHEISHYIKDHVRETYIEVKKTIKDADKFEPNEIDKKIKSFSKYQQTNEFDADFEGIRFLSKTDYDISEVETCLKVLAGADLPCVDYVVDSTFFRSIGLTVPFDYFPDSVASAVVNLEYNDEESTHPNIKRRIDNVKKEFNREDSSFKKFVLPESRFNEIVKLSRFELINQYILRRDFINALYLTEYYRSNGEVGRFTDESLLKSLYGISKYKYFNQLYKVFGGVDSSIGNMYSLIHMFDQMSTIEVYTISYKHALELSEKYPTENLFQLYLEDLRIDLSKELKLAHSQISTVLENSDSTSNSTTNLSHVEHFHTCSFDGLMTNEELRPLYESTYQSTPITDPISNDDVKNIKEIDHLNADKVVLVDPLIINYGLNLNKKKFIRSEKNKTEFSKALSKKYRKLDLEVDVLNSKQFVPENIEDYNDLALLKMWRDETLLHENNGMISSLRPQIIELSERKNTDHFLYTGIFAFKTTHPFTFTKGMAMMVVWTIPFVLYDVLKIHNHFNFVSFSINAENNRIEFVDIHFVDKNTTKINLEFQAYNVLYQIGHK